MNYCVSVVVAAYNAQDTLNHCIQSLQTSTLRDFEVLVVDDGSTDSTYHFARERAQHDARIQPFRRIHGGVSAARNYGIENARGEFICFVDADDTVDPGYLSTLYNMASRFALDWVACSYFEIQGNSSEDTWAIPFAFDKNDIWHEETARSVACRAIWRGPSGQSGLSSSATGMYRRSVIADNNIRFAVDVSFGEDMLFNRDVAHVLRGFGYIRAHLYNYIRRSTSATGASNILEQIARQEELLVRLENKRIHYGEAPFEEQRLYAQAWVDATKSRIERIADSDERAAAFNALETTCKRKPLSAMLDLGTSDTLNNSTAMRADSDISERATTTDGTSKISLISPFYNVEAYFDRFLATLRLQTLEDIEIILVDDCSTDGSRAIAERHAADDPRIRIITNSENIGLGSSRNVGIQYARGTYLSFPDSDDWVDAGFYEDLWSAAETNGFPDIVKGRLEGGPIEHPEYLDKQIEVGLAHGQPLYTLFVWQHTTAIYHRCLFDNYDVKHGESRTSEDGPFLLRACSKARTFYLTQSPAAYHYALRAHSLSTTFSRARHLSDVQAFSEQIDYLLEAVEKDAWLYHYVGGRFRAYYKNLVRAGEAGIVHEQVWMPLLRQQIMRLPEPNRLLGMFEPLDALLSYKLRSFTPPETPLLSVIVPVHNMEHTLPRALESILAQDCESYELIVVADTCTDGTLELAREYARSYPQMRVIEVTHTRVSSTRNVGIKAALGTYLMFLDADDFYLPNALKTVAHAISKHKPDVMFSRQNQGLYASLDASALELPTTELLHIMDGTLLEASAWSRDWKTLQPTLRGPWGNAYRASFLREHKIVFDERLSVCEDRLFNRAVLACSPTALLVETSTYYYALDEKQGRHIMLEALENMASEAECLLRDYETFGIENKWTALHFAQIMTLSILDYAVLDGSTQHIAWVRMYLTRPTTKKILELLLPPEEGQPLYRVLSKVPELLDLID